MHNAAVEKLLDVIFPRVCGNINKKSICNKCSAKLAKEYKFYIDNYESDLSKNLHKLFSRNNIGTQIEWG